MYKPSDTEMPDRLTGVSTFSGQWQYSSYHPVFAQIRFLPKSNNLIPLTFPVKLVSTTLTIVTSANRLQRSILYVTEWWLSENLPQNYSNGIPHLGPQVETLNDI